MKIQTIRKLINYTLHERAPIKGANSLWKRAHLKGFSLLEIAIVLMIMGILMGGLLKGIDLLEGAKIRSTLNELKTIQLAILNYKTSYGCWPGDDGQARRRFGETVSRPSTTVPTSSIAIADGDGNGQVSTAQEQQMVWVHSFAAGFLPSPLPPSCKLGGIFTVHFEEGAHWLKIGQGDQGTRALLLPKQAQLLKKKVEEDGGLLGAIEFCSGEGLAPTACMTADNHFNLANRTPACILKMMLE